MTIDTDARIEELIDKLMDPNVTESEIEKIEKKLKVLKDLS